MVKSVLHLENTALATLNTKLPWNTSQLSTQLAGTLHKSTFFCGLQNLYLAAILAAKILKDCFPQAPLSSFRWKTRTCIFPTIPTARSIQEPAHSYPGHTGCSGLLEQRPAFLECFKNCRAAWQCPGRAKPFFCSYYTWIYLTDCFYPSNPWFKEVKLNRSGLGWGH